MLTNEQLRNIIDVGSALTAEKNKVKLLGMIIDTAMEISNCDAGTLYLYKDNLLHFMIMKTLSQNVSKGENGEPIDLPPVAMSESNVCSYTAIHKELVNIQDVYHSDRFDFSGPRKYDAITGYHTESMLVIPMENTQGELIGVLQLINAQDENGAIVPFDEDAEFVLRSLGSQAAVAFTNLIYTEEIKKQMYSFVEAFATTIDARTPYNGSHTRMVTVYARLLANYMNKLHAEGKCEDYFDDNRMEQLQLAAALHDIGKMVIPLSVMNKATRLDERLEKVEDRFKLLMAYYEADGLKGRITKEEAEEKINYLKDGIAFITSANGAGFLPDESLERINEIAACVYEKEDGEKIPYLTEEERVCMNIRKGTLTNEERGKMEEHVVMTARILDKVYFNSQYKNVAKFAASHHELLNGSGYPDHLEGDALELESRMLAVVDVFDALTCTDRPYKVPMPKEKALSILQAMVDEGKMEQRLVTWLGEALETEDMAELRERSMF